MSCQDAPNEHPTTGTAEPSDTAKAALVAALSTGPDPAVTISVICASCRRSRTVADDYDYTLLQLFTGRPLGWFNGDGEQMCGQCLTALMKGQLP